FFFSGRRRHTRSKRDWSSDVCSSDREYAQVEQGPVPALQDQLPPDEESEDDRSAGDRGPGQSGRRGTGLTSAAELAEAEDDAAEGERREDDREDVDRRMGRLAEVGHPLRAESE